MSGPSAVISAEEGRRWSDAEALTAVHWLQGKVLLCSAPNGISVILQLPEISPCSTQGRGPAKPVQSWGTPLLTSIPLPSSPQHSHSTCNGCSRAKIPAFLVVPTASSPWWEEARGPRGRTLGAAPPGGVCVAQGRTERAAQTLLAQLCGTISPLLFLPALAGGQQVTGAALPRGPAAPGHRAQPWGSSSSSSPAAPPGQVGPCIPAALQRARRSCWR